MGFQFIAKIKFKKSKKTSPTLVKARFVTQLPARTVIIVFTKIHLGTFF